MSKQQNRSNFEAAKKAIEQLRSDMSVAWQTVRDQLEELSGMCESTIEAMQEEYKDELD